MGFHVRNITVAANSELPIGITGTQLACIEGSVSEFEISIDGGPFSYFAPGMKYTIAPGEKLFTEARIKNTTGSSITLKVAYGTGDFEDNRALFAGTVNMKEVVPDVVKTKADVNVNNTTTTQVFDVSADAGSAGAVEVTICNPSSAVTMRVGDSNAGAARGAIVPRGGSITFWANADVYVYQASGAALAIPVMWTERT